jgi:hypothetical protein
MVEVKFSTDGKNLFINGKKVIRGWESFSGWYWFAVEEVQRQDTILSSGKVAKNDIIYFGFVQGLEEEWGDFSLAELESLKPRVWEIPNKNLPYSGRRR